MSAFKRRLPAIWNTTIWTVNCSASFFLIVRLAVAETCCWHCADAQTIKVCLWICSLSDCWLCNKTPSTMGKKNKKNIHPHFNPNTKKCRFAPHKASFFICIQRGVEKKKPSSAQAKLSDHPPPLKPPLLKCTSFLWPPLPPFFVT